MLFKLESGIFFNNVRNCWKFSRFVPDCETKKSEQRLQQGHIRFVKVSTKTSVESSFL